MFRNNSFQFRNAIFAVSLYWIKFVAYSIGGLVRVCLKFVDIPHHYHESEIAIRLTSENQKHSAKAYR